MIDAPGSAAIAELLGRVPLFHDLAPELLPMVAAEATLRRVTAGTVLFRMGDDGDEMFVVAHGLVRILVPGASGEEVVAELGSGRWFGEMALITGEPRSATARIAVDSDVLVLTRAGFHSLLARMPVLGVRLSAELSRRLRARLVESSAAIVHRVIALEEPGGLADGGAAAREIAAAVAEELGATVGYIDLAGDAPAPADGRVQTHRCDDLDDLERVRRSHAAVVLRIPAGHPWREPLGALSGVTVDTAALASPPRWSRSAGPPIACRSSPSASAPTSAPC